ncbi:glycoside hydrolase family 88 protein [Cerasicoccus fimbriatus]|uniref:glycoside hydrolase family 88 protein n=1 Tax=Cerasicoccus fimbriatus TaxID=3014554 RepID=UPI0022B2D314|nr:glycoside hydrolase family 88 protein [Cerasicoccus sp. TK19100]
MNLRVNYIPSEGTNQSSLGGIEWKQVLPGLVFEIDDPKPGWLSLMVACDLRADCVVSLEDDCGNVHQIDASFASHGQRLRVAWPAGSKRLCVTSIEGEGALWIASAAGFAPCFVEDNASIEQRREAALERLRQDALCQFSWMGGCVLDGMQQLSQTANRQVWQKAIHDWLSYFVKADELRYQSPRGELVLNLFNNIEGTLPVAVIAREDPWHPVCDLALEMFNRLAQNNDGRILNVEITAEGCYTVAYPLAVLSKGRGDEALQLLALHQLELRREQLFYAGDIYLRSGEHGRSFRNWTRGICWYLLGIARCLSVLGVDKSASLCAHFVERAAWIIARQREDGLWDNFLDEPGFPPDSSGSCGIAAALMTGHSLGLLGDEARQCAQRTWEGVGRYLEPDGWLGCVAPNNKRGEASQHTRRRTIEPFALGLYAQLAASLRQ